MIRILHTADWHLGVKLENQFREEEHQLTLDWLSKLIISENIDVLIIAGDIFDVYMPASYAQRLYYNFLKSLINTCCQHIIVIGGNHDSPNLLEASRQLLQMLNIHVVAQITDDYQEQIIELRDLKSQELKAVVAAVPYLSEAVLRKSYLGETADDRRNQIRQGVIDHYQNLADLVSHYKEKNIPIIATGHLFVAGGDRGERKGSIIHLGNIDIVEPSAFPTVFDYVALGHLHKAHPVDKDKRIRYAGSLIPLDFNEASYKHQVYAVDFVDGKLHQVHSHHNPYCRQLCLVRGDLKEINNFIDNYAHEMPENQLKTWLKIEAQTNTPFIANFKQQLLEKIGNKPLEILGEPIQLRNSADDNIEIEMHKALAAIPSLDSISPEEVFNMRLKSQQYDDPVIIAQFQADFRDLQIWHHEQNIKNK